MRKLPSRELSRGVESVKVYFTPEVEAKLSQTASQSGREPTDIVQDAVSRYFDEETRFVEAVERGEAALRSGEYLTHDQVGQRLQRFLQP
jgi:predicted transcriptional regulator